MTIKHAGYVVLVGGVILETAEVVAKTNATVDNVVFNETPLGSVIGKVEQILPVSLGWTVIIVGAIMVWIAPRLIGD